MHATRRMLGLVTAQDFNRECEDYIRRVGGRPSPRTALEFSDKPTSWRGARLNGRRRRGINKQANGSRKAGK